MHVLCWAFVGLLLGVYWARVGSMLGCVTVLGLCWAMLDLCCANVGTILGCTEACWAVRAYVGPMLSFHVGPMLGPCGAHVGPMLGHVAT